MAGGPFTEIYGGYPANLEAQGGVKLFVALLLSAYTLLFPPPNLFFSQQEQI